MAHNRGILSIRRLVLFALVCSLWVTPVQAQTLPMGVPDFGTWPGCEVVAVGQTRTIGTANLSCLAVHGTLHLQSPVAFTVGTLLIYADGVLECDTPCVGELVISNTPIDTTKDPEQYGTGLLGFGKVRLFGRTLTPTFTRLTDDVVAGALTLAVTDTIAAGWLATDRLLLPDARQKIVNNPAPPDNDEIVSLGGVSGQTLTVSATTGAHVGVREQDGTTSARPHVGNLSRSFVIRSAVPAGTRGHVWFSGRADVDIRYVAFQDLGRTRWQAVLDSTAFNVDGSVAHVGTNQIGRYPLHLHHLDGPVGGQANGHSATLIGNAVERSTKWGVTIHGTSFALVTDNVLYDVGGAGIMTEDGSETQNTIAHNFVVKVPGNGSDRPDERESTNDYGYEGAGLWLSNSDNYVRDNVVAQAPSMAYVFYVERGETRQAPAVVGEVPATRTVAIHAIPIREFARNEAYSSMSGLSIWYIGASGSWEMFETAESVVKDFRAWHLSRRGLYGYPMNRVTFDGWWQRANLSLPEEPSIGLFFSDYSTRHVKVTHADIQNVRAAMIPSFKLGDTRDIYGTEAGTFLVEDSTLGGQISFYTGTPWGVVGGGTGLPASAITLRRVTFKAWPGQEHFDIQLNYLPGEAENPNTTVKQTITVEGVNGTAEAFQVFYAQQAPSFVVPQTSGGFIGSPEAGLTNAQNWAKYGLAIAGAVAPCTTTRVGYTGFVCPTGITPPPPPPPVEICGNGLDDDLDGQIDENCVPPSAEVCGDGIDNDGDGQIDEGCPPVSGAPSVSMATTQCKVTVSAVPPTATGWKAQFKRDGVNLGNADATAPYERSTTLAPGSYSFSVVWTKTGAPTVTSPATLRACP